MATKDRKDYNTLFDPQDYLKYYTEVTDSAWLWYPLKALHGLFQSYGTTSVEF